MTIAAGIFRQYDIRGVVGDDLTIEAAEGIGTARGNRATGQVSEHSFRFI